MRPYPAGKDYYQILRIDKDATFEEIHKAFRTLARRYHPDITAEDLKFAEEKFKEISEAYNVLANPEKRAVYDQLHGYDIYRAMKRGIVHEHPWWDDEVFIYQDDSSTKRVKSPFSFVRTQHYYEEDPFIEMSYKIIHVHPKKKLSLIWRIKTRIKTLFSFFIPSRRERGSATSTAGSDASYNRDVKSEPHKIKTKSKD